MIKDEFETDNDIIKDYSNNIDIEGVGTVYLGNSYINTPQWVESFFINRINADSVFTTNARAILLVRIQVGQENQRKTFALTMGLLFLKIIHNCPISLFLARCRLDTRKADFKHLGLK